MVSGLKIKAQNDALTHSNSSVDFNEIERQFRTIGKRQSTVVQRSRDDILADVKRPGRPPPPIPAPYSRRREFKAFLTEGETHRPQPLTPPLPHRKLNLKDQSDVNLISFEGQANSSLFSSLQQPTATTKCAYAHAKETHNFYRFKYYSRAQVFCLYGVCDPPGVTGAIFRRK